MGLKVFLSYGHDGNTTLVLRIKRDLTAAGHRRWQRNLSISHNNVGDALSAQGDLPRALDAVRAATDIRARLADTGNPQWQRDVIVSFMKLAEADPAHARPAFERALEIARELSASGRLAPVDAQMPAELERRLSVVVP